MAKRLKTLQSTKDKRTVLGSAFALVLLFVLMYFCLEVGGCEIPRRINGSSANSNNTITRCIAKVLAIYPRF
jgi:hypothetical protein